MKWSKYFRFSGLILLLIFLLSGVYMYETFPAIYGSNEVIRYQFRANHIYILLAALTHLATGLISYKELIGWRNLANKIGCILLALAPALLVLAFIEEPVKASDEKPYTFFGIAFMLAGTLLLYVQLIPNTTKDES